MEPDLSLPHTTETKTCHYPESESQMSPVHNPHPNPPTYFLKTHFNIILTYSYTIQVVSFPQVSPSKPYIHLFSHILLMTHPSLSFLIPHSNNIWWGVQIIKLLIMHSPKVPVTSSLLGPNIFLSTLFSNTLSLHSSASVKDQVSQPHNTTEKLQLCIFVFASLDSQ